MIKNIIFDLGGVLVDWDPLYVYYTVFDTEEEAQWFINNICTLEWNEEQDGGRLIKTAVDELLQLYPEWEREINIYYDRWEEMLRGQIDGTVDILQKLKKELKYGLFALTNWSGELFPVARKKYQFLQHFEGIIVSGDEKLKKPDPKIYQLLLDRYNLKAEECLFIDDNLRNIKAAAKMGINSIHFESSDKLAHHLKELKIL